MIKFQKNDWNWGFRDFKCILRIASFTDKLTNSDKDTTCSESETSIENMQQILKEKELYN